MLLDDLIINEVQIIRCRALDPTLDSSSSKPTPTVPLRQEISRVNAQPRVYPRPTLALNALNVKVMGMWRSSAQVSRTLFLDDQSDEVQDESQKDIVFIENTSSDSENDMGHEKFLNTIRRIAIV